MTTDEIRSQFAQVCQKLGELSLQHMDVTENLASLNAQIAKLREQSRQLGKEFTEASRKEAENVAVLDPAD